MGMKFKVVIAKDGKMMTEVLERGEHLCSKIYQVTNAVGRQVSDETIGPECDEQHETVTGGGGS